MTTTNFNPYLIIDASGGARILLPPGSNLDSCNTLVPAGAIGHQCDVYDLSDSCPDDVINGSETGRHVARIRTIDAKNFKRIEGIGAIRDAIMKHEAKSS